MRISGGYHDGTALSRIYRQGQLVWEGTPSPNTTMRTVVTQNRVLQATDSRSLPYQNCRWVWRIAADCSKIVVSFPNWYSSNGGVEDVPNALPFEKASFELLSTGQKIPITMDGSRAFSIAPGAMDPHSLAILPSDFPPLAKFSRLEQVAIKTRIAKANLGDGIPYPSRQTNECDGQQVWWSDANTTVSDVDDFGPFTYTGTAPQTGIVGYCPIILGVPLVDGESWYGPGDSNNDGLGITRNNTQIDGAGLFQFAMAIRMVPSLNFARSGNVADVVEEKMLHFARYARYGMENFAANDIGVNGAVNMTDYNTKMSHKVALYTGMRAQGIEKILAQYPLPRSGSTNLWIDKDGQVWNDAVGAGNISMSKWGPGGLVETTYHPQLEAWLADGTVDATVKYETLRDPTSYMHHITNGTQRYATNDGTHPSNFAAAQAAIEVDEKMQEIASGSAIVLAPHNTVAPVVSGTGEAGEVLSCTQGTWLRSPTSYAYQWKSGGVAIIGETSSTYTVVEADEGASISCTVTATNAGGSTAANSNSITIAGDEFDPLTEPSLAGWYDPTDLASFTDNGGGAVSPWNDKSGDGNHLTQATAAKRFISGADSVNGHNVFYLDGTKVMPLPAAFSSLGSGDFTLIFCYEYTQSPGESFLIGAASSGQFWGLNLNNWGNDVGRFAPNAAAGPRLASRTALNTPMIAGMKKSGTSGWFFNEAAISGPATISNGNLSGGFIGGGFSEQFKFRGNLLAGFIFNDDLSNAQINNFNAFLAAKFGFTTIPF